VEFRRELLSAFRQGGNADVEPSPPP